MTTDAALLARASRGDPEALDTLIRIERPAAVRLAGHLLGDEAAAQDIAQDVMVRLEAALPGFRGDAAVSTWVYRVTLNLCTDHQRRIRRRRHDVDIDAPDQQGALAVHPDREHDLDVHRAREAVRAAVAALPDEQREAVVLRFLEGLPYAEIARLTNTPQGTVASRVFRALERLGREIEPRHLEIVT